MQRKLTKKQVTIPNAVNPRMHCQKITNLRTLSSDTANQAFWETSQVETVHHVKSCYGTLNCNFVHRKTTISFHFLTTFT